MKALHFKTIFLLACFLIPITSYGQIGYARRIVPAAALPAICQPGNGDVIFLTAPASSIGMYQCRATNTWGPIGLASVAEQLNIAQGTLTTSAPFVNQTATWNAGGVTFTNFLSTVTDTASAAASLLFDFHVGANPILTLRKDGLLTAAPAGAISFLGRSEIHSSADGLITFRNAAGTGFTRLNLGPSGTATHPSIAVSPAVAGQTQGIIILKADGSAAAIADLGAATDGSIIYCSDCTIASPCAVGGTGALAKRLNGVWVCN